MDKQVLIVEMPDLSDEAVVSIQGFLWDFMNTFESHYYYQLKRYYKNKEAQHGE